MTQRAARPPHPGRTRAQRRVLDAIGCGDTRPPMHPKVRRDLLDEGLIVQVGAIQHRDRLGAYEIPEYGMPLDVHYRWCTAVSHGVSDDEI